jgi:hypothetical protein
MRRGKPVCQECGHNRGSHARAKFGLRDGPCSHFALRDGVRFECKCREYVRLGRTGEPRKVAA